MTFHIRFIFWEAFIRNSNVFDNTFLKGIFIRQRVGQRVGTYLV